MLDFDVYNWVLSHLADEDWWLASYHVFFFEARPLKSPIATLQYFFEAILVG